MKYVICISAILPFGFISGYLIGKCVEGGKRETAGYINAKIEVVKELNQYFDKISSTEYKDAILIFTVKETSVYAVDENGVRTIRLNN